ncbi:MAG: DNA adenine methylase, partial [Treponema sp.]|nr:DNA adenine methylase [Treponema sp.]
MNESREYLTSQIITYLGNKRSLLGDIEAAGTELKAKLGKEKCVCADLFSGSGIVSRLLKKHSQLLYVNDLENYSCMLSSCYLTDRKDFDEKKYDEC